ATSFPNSSRMAPGLLSNTLARRWRRHARPRQIIMPAQLVRPCRKRYSGWSQGVAERMGNAIDLEKEAAARASLRFVRDGDIVGLGTGSTAAYAVKFLAEKVRAGLKIRGIPTSVHTRDLAASLGIPLTTLDEFQEIDVTIDGADEFDPRLNLTK